MYHSLCHTDHCQYIDANILFPSDSVDLLCVCILVILLFYYFSGKRGQRHSIVRTEEVGLAAEMRNKLQKQASRESTDGSVCSFSSDSSSQ